jgi:hypothetical protein
VDVVFVSVVEMLRTNSLPAFIDSGADGTIVPLAYLEEIHAPPTIEMACAANGESDRPSDP